MKDSVVVQLGTPEELVTAPADNYVAQFTKDLPRGKPFTVSAIMQPADLEGAAGAAEPVNAVLNDLAPRLLATEGATPVRDEARRAVGRIDRERLAEALFAEGIAQAISVGVEHDRRSSPERPQPEGLRFSAAI